MRGYFLFVVAACAAALLIGCGGGGGGGGDSPPAVQSLRGTVATGAPVANATITVVDSTGAVVGTGTADADGVYEVTVSVAAVPPLVIKASGIVGDSVQDLYSVTDTLGTANVSQVTTAVTATLSGSGDPASTFDNAGSMTLTSNEINTVDDAYSAAFSNFFIEAISFIKSTFDSSMDAALDNIKIQIKPSGTITLATTSSMASNDLVEGASSSAQLSTVIIESGDQPASTAADTLTNTALLTIEDLENMRSKLQNCFTIPLASRGDPTNPASACANENFVASNDPNSTDGFKHSGLFWNNPNWSNVGATESSYWYGLFGLALKTTKFDNAIFFKPKIIRLLDSTESTWVVQFPVQLNSGILANFGDYNANRYLVVKKINGLISSNDNGYRLIGDQRDYAVAIQSNIQSTSKTSSPNITQIDTGLRVGIFEVSSTDISGRKIILAQVKGKGLPADGVYLARNSNPCEPTFDTKRLSSAFLSELSTPIDGTGLSTADFSDPVIVSLLQTITANVICSNYFRMSSTNDYMRVSGAVRSWGVDGLRRDPDSAPHLTDTEIESIGFSEAYYIKVWLSDGSTLNYINRLLSPLPTLTSAQAYAYYPKYTMDTLNRFKIFDGAPVFSVDLEPNTNLYQFKAALFWNRSTAESFSSLKPNDNSTVIDCPSGTCGSWWETDPVPIGKAAIKIFSRTSDGLLVTNQYSNN